MKKQLFILIFLFIPLISYSQITFPVGKSGSEARLTIVEQGFTLDNIDRSSSEYVSIYTYSSANDKNLKIQLLITKKGDICSTISLDLLDSQIPKVLKLMNDKWRKDGDNKWISPDNKQISTILYDTSPKSLVIVMKI